MEAPNPAVAKPGAKPDLPLWDDALARYVVRAEVPWEERDGRIVVAMPRDDGPVARAFSFVFRAPRSVSVRLDEPGSASWLLADGTRTAEEIARELAAKFGGEGWMGRVKTFATTLQGHGLLRLATEPTRATDSLRGFPEHLGYRTASCKRCSTVVRLKGPRRAIYQCPGCRRIGRAADAPTPRP